jgi:hypothetical protein
MVVGLQLAKLKEPEVDVWEYQSCLGTLMYAMLGTHPELTFTITVLLARLTLLPSIGFSTISRKFLT